ncbi:helix-turn-helix transcriptional regulator [Streptomyces sp. NPDC059076]|uniref:helix-turn-helix transcriptional regulator n=1 Tax=unclassified Streptomyces TaxID=2593676 RepID=UPI0036AC11FA
MTTERELWTAAQCAEHWGVKESTWRSYAARAQVPQPVDRSGRTPLWDSAAVKEELTARTIARQPLLAITLPLDDVLRDLRTDMRSAVDPTVDAENRTEAAQRTGHTLRALRQVMHELSVVAARRSEEDGRASRSVDVDDTLTPTDDNREQVEAWWRDFVWGALTKDLNSVEATLVQEGMRFDRTVRLTNNPESDNL